jgi:mono/diheme cytochrome c family protein
MRNRRRSAAGGTRFSIGIAAVVLCAAGLATLGRPARARDAGETTAHPRDVRFTVDAAAIPDDTLLAEQLEHAVDLRRRETFDRMLDAGDPGELVEHARLTDVDFEHRTLGIDTLFVVGDELFAYLFRPENGWGHGPLERERVGFTPRLRRVHLGASGGPDAFACFSCHSKGGPDGAGTQSQNAFLRGDGRSTASADERNAPHLLGLGPIACLAREMSAALQAQAQAALALARAEKRHVEHELATKGVSFGRIRATPDGALDFGAVEGVDADLIVKPFGWKGHQATLRGITEESLHQHQGLLSKRVQLAARDGAIDRSVYGGGPWYDSDEDGVSLEIDAGMLATVVGYLAQLETPVVRPPRDPGLLDMFASGRVLFDEIGCASCHTPTLELEDTKLDARDEEATSSAFVLDVAVDGDGPKIEPEYAAARTSYLVHLFSDLKRHDMGAALAGRDQGDIGASVFLTRPLWGLAETAPYLHDGRAPTLQEAIALHGGEAAPARDAYLALDAKRQASVRVFLASLSRQPKLFVP